MNFKVKKKSEINKGQVIYSKQELSFDFKPIYSADYLLLIGYTNLSFDSESKNACQVWGCNPINTWINKILKKPKSIRGNLILDTELELGDNKRYVEAGEWTTYFDKRNGWVCIGEYEEENNDIAVEFAENTIAVVNQENLKALWLKPMFIE
ncbi:hypothetical protein [Clostridium butyricum]|uniref:hypothetical protein n=1 Tax=Clostridium butyricum TaxID=1492 RepID=UPI00168BFBC5|nr:hypothetical protein [Clostridium butyricum]MDB2152532.1 hypothetical protein [Clostridium butyricum]